MRRRFIKWGKYCGLALLAWMSILPRPLAGVSIVVPNNLANAEAGKQ